MDNALNSVASIKWDSRGKVKLELSELWLSMNSSGAGVKQEWEYLSEWQGRIKDLNVMAGSVNMNMASVH